MSADQIIERVRKAQPGTLRIFRSPDPDIKIEVALANESNIRARFQHALTSGCVIEALSLRMLWLERQLKIYVRNVQPKSEEPKRMFGRLVEQAERLGFAANLAKRLQAFNDVRVAAIHHFLTGQTTYEQINEALMMSDDLGTQVMLFVVQNSGEPLTEEGFMRFNYVGDLVLDTEVYLSRDNICPV